MSVLFLSHSSKDNAAALKVRDWLRDHGYSEIFLDLDPESGLAPGQRWRDELKRAGERCAAVVVLVSPSWVASSWCRTEFLLAVQLGKRVFPILVAQTPFEDLPHELVAHFQLADISDPSRESEGFASVAAGLRRAGLSPSDFPWPPEGESSRAPYRGLAALQEKDAGIFFGRDAPIVRGLDALRRMRDGSSERILAVLGASGAGKSSFLRAGLLARLRRDEASFAVLPVIRPRAAALTGPEGLNAAIGGQARVVEDLLAAFERVRSTVIDRMQRYSAAGHERFTPPNPTIVISIDQAEELFTAENDEAGKAVELVAKALTQDINALLVLTIRSDRYDRFQQVTHLASIPRQPFDLSPLSPSSFKEVIEKPAKLVELEVEPGLTERLLEDMEQDDALPLLAFTLERLYLRREPGQGLTLSDYEKGLRGLAGAIQGAVDTALSGARADPLLPRTIPELLVLTRDVFLSSLVAIDDVTAAPRRRVATLGEVPPATRALISYLVDQRILISDASLRGEDPTIEIAHEAILRHWPELANWIEDARENLVQLEALRRAASEWEHSRRKPDLLTHRGARLDAAEALLGQEQFSLAIGPTPRAYLNQCRTAERSVAHWRNLVTSVIVSLGIAVGIAVAAGLFALVHIAAATDHKEAETLAEMSEFAADNGDYDRALRFAIAAYTKDRDLSNDAIGRPSAVALESALSRFPLIQPGFGTIESAVVVAISPDSSRVVVGSDFGEMQIFDSQTGLPVSTRFKPDGKLVSVVFSSDSKRVLTLTEDYNVQAWDARTGRSIGRPATYTSSFSNLRFGPHGNLSSKLPTGQILYMSGGLFTRARHAYAGRIWGFSPQCSRVVTVEDDGGIKIWDDTTGHAIGAPLRSDDALSSVGLSSDCNYVALGFSSSMLVWDARAGSLSAQAIKGFGNINSIQFSRDDRHLLVASANGAVQTFDRASGQPLGLPLKLGSGVACAVFSPDEKKIVSVTTLGWVDVWDNSPGRFAEGHLQSGPLLQAVYDLSNDRVATVSDQRIAQMWNLTTGDEIGTGRKIDDILSDMPFSSDGELLIALAGQGVTVWKASDVKSQFVTSIAQQSDVANAAFDFANKQVTTISVFGIVQVWDLLTGKKVGGYQRIHNRPLGSNGERRPGDVERIGSFNSDHTRITFGSYDDAVAVWDTTKNATMAILPFRNGGFYNTSFSPDGDRLFVSHGDGTSSIWNLRTNSQVGATQRVSGGVVQSEFNGDGSILLTRTNEGMVQLWDAKTGAKLVPELGMGNSVVGAALSPDSRHLFGTSYDGVPRVWDISKFEKRLTGEAALSQACHLLGGGAVLQKDDLTLAPFLDAGRDFAESGNVCKPRGRLERLYTSVWQ